MAVQVSVSTRWHIEDNCSPRGGIHSTVAPRRGRNGQLPRPTGFMALAIGTGTTATAVMIQTVSCLTMRRKTRM
jgi:hypothetical protein